MNYWPMILLSVFASIGWAEPVDELRLIQARAQLPSLQLWVDVPQSISVNREQFAANLGSETTQIQSVQPFIQTGEGVAYIFLVDVSRSLTSAQFTQIKQALVQWLANLRTQDKAALITFGNEVITQSDFSAKPELLGTVMDNLTASDKQTRFYQGLLAAIQLGRRLDVDLPARRGIVVLSDGMDDNVSGVSVEEVMAQTQEYRVPIYSIGFASEPLNPAKRQGLKVMGLLARQSGGYFVQARADALDQAYRQQQQHIMQAYSLQLTCTSCVADGQLYRLSLSWRDGQRSFAEGLDMRLLPDVQAQPRLHQQPVEQTNQQAHWFIAVAGLVLLAGLLVVLWRQRMAVKVAANRVAFIPAAVNAPESSPKLMVYSAFVLELTVVNGVHKGQRHRLPMQQSVILGRAAGCDLVLTDDEEVSAQHARIDNHGDKLLLQDLNSTNGTFVNGVAIHNPYLLQSGDLLLLGRTEFRLLFK